MTQKELGYVELEWTCKHCGTINPGMKRVCTNCGAPIGQDDKFELPDQQELITQQEKLEEAKKGPAIQCPYCNVLNPADTKLCIQCGGDIQEGLARQAGQVLGAYKPDAVPDKPCPNCGQPVKANAQRCPNCGGSLVEADKTVAPPAKSNKTPIWLVVGLIALGILCVGSIIGFIIMSNRTNDISAIVSDIHWKHAIEILEQRPVQKSDWREDLPSEAQNVSCRDEYKETSSNPAPNATEVCGTPYTIDQGSGAGKVVQDCEYQIYASYCDFTVQEWVVVNTAMAEGYDNNPQWPVINLLSGQQEGNRIEEYQVTFNADGETYTYTPDDFSEYSQFDVGSEWLLSINTFGAIKELRNK
jgi:RNA polymerase subunit RPABC4/transcription elongation factor Spt4